jgi:NAD(P)-dependent dehydrogenase (short-subunit alcohol dehydrogenase family)
MHIEGSVAFVTGANKGIGAAIVQALLEAGVAKVYAAMRTLAATDDPRVVPVELDITNAAQLARAVSLAGDVQILVNNAGIALGQSLLGAPDTRAAEAEMRVNYFGTLDVTRALAPTLHVNGGGAIVNVLSILGRVSAPRIGSYSASKAAAVSLTQGIRGELAAQGTLVIGVLPGYVDTDMARHTQGPKLTARQVADDIVAALRSGTEDVYPGMAAEVEKGLRHDPKAVEVQLRSLGA